MLGYWQSPYSHIFHLSVVLLFVTTNGSMLIPGNSKTSTSGYEVDLRSL